MSVVLFEDSQVATLDPAALGKPAFAISCGGYRLIDLAAQLGGPLRACVRPHVRAVTAADYPALAGAPVDSKKPTLWVNARLVPSVRLLARLRSMLASGKPGIVQAPSGVSAALLPPGATLDDGSADPPTPEIFAALALPALEHEMPLFEYPHDIIRYHLTTLAENLEPHLISGRYHQLADGVFAAPTAKIGQNVVTDTRRGPIVIDDQATIGPYCYLSGPVYVGRAARVLEHAALKDAVAIGPVTKVGGEVEASIIEAYTNKQHHGFLGHSYLGSWINLGAGTCNSDLKNTYGRVNMEYRGQKVATGMQFVGAIIGDYAKTAINTGIFTGKTVGACSMVYGFVTTNVPSFVNYARLFGQVTEAPVEVMVATQRRMFERRGVEQRPCDIQLLHDMYALTVQERQRSGESLSLEPLSL
jgi:UDP-N-acetylglucosamine diphosphorylase / glucose-1-phosphate thymidylyltransferase / UDP-N-acetylgalactosamine diphosphorylase / glucosamine-1-phosphate N-acetyltransferase / galactosamine-1-phosphate N-acetyltransferase